MRYECLDIHVDYQKVGAEQDGTQPKLLAYLLDESPELPQNAVRPAVIICAGGLLPTEFLNAAGIRSEAKFGTA